MSPNLSIIFNITKYLIFVQICHPTQHMRKNTIVHTSFIMESVSNEIYALVQDLTPKTSSR